MYDLVGLPELHYAGSHGMDIISPVHEMPNGYYLLCRDSTDKQEKEVNLFQPATEFLPMIDEVCFRYEFLNAYHYSV